MTPERRPSHTPQSATTQPSTIKLSGFALAQKTMSELVIDNPVLTESQRAYRKMFRSGRSAQIVAFVILLIIYVWLDVECLAGRSDCSVPFSYLELILITLAIPASIYGAVSGEREHGTWDALVLTRLTTGQIIFGKLVWRLRSILLIALGCLIPIGCSLTGSVFTSTTMNSLILSQCMIICWGILLGAFGLWVSSITKRSITSLAIIAFVIIAVLLAFPTLYGFFAGMTQSSSDIRAGETNLIGSTLYTFNPYVALMTTLGTEGSYKPPWPSGLTGILQIEVYLAAAVLLTTLTYLRLRVLELPIRGRR